MPGCAFMQSPLPLLIDAVGHTCAAWWHAPAPAADAGAAPALPRGWLPAGPLPLAVVLASSWGEEDIRGYDGQRALAIALAESGIGTLRFEWPDTGDSSAATGTTSNADALAAFDAAATQALALSGCTRLAFVGLRLGALLAAHAAVARTDVDALVALLPVASGRAFVREQRLPDAGGVAAVPALAPAGAFDPAELPVQLGGFAQPLRQLEAMSALRWPSQATSSLRDALLLWPPAAPGRAGSDALAGLGVRVREWAHEELSGTLAASRRAGLAPVAIVEIVRWLQERAGDAAAAHGAAAAGASATEDGRTVRMRAAVVDAQLEAATGAVLALSAAGARRWMRLQQGPVAVRECLVRIGDARDREPPLLAGVVSERDVAPGPDGARPFRRGVVLLSSGRERRIGPHRLWVPWARQRAALGDVVLRLDLPGIGDSERHAAPDLDPLGPDDARGAEAVARAAAWLRREHGVADCTVMGVGWGAWQAWRAALAGVDVQQVVAIDLPILHWAAGGVDIATDSERSLLDPMRWWNLLTAHGRHALRLQAREIARWLRWPLHNDLADELARVSARGVALDFVFSSPAAGVTPWREETGRSGMRLARDSRVKVCVLGQPNPGFEWAAGRTELYASLDSLLLPMSTMTSSPVSPSSHQPVAARP